MVILTIIINLGVLFFSSSGLKSLIDNSDNLSKYDLFLIVTLIEHVLILILIIFYKLVNNEPKWIKKLKCI